MVLISHGLKKYTGTECRLPWRLTGLVVSIAAPLVAFINISDGYVPALILLAIGILFFTDTILGREATGFYPAGIVTAWGVWLSLERVQVDQELITFVLCVLVTIYFLAGLEAERRKLPAATLKFLTPLYYTAHFITFVILIRIYIHPLAEFLGGSAWSDTMQLWGAADQLLLALVYGMFAWGRYEERWGHLAAWLAMIGRGLIAIIYSHGHGFLACQGAIIRVLMVLAERG